MSMTEDDIRKVARILRDEMGPATLPQFLTTEEAARLARVSTKTIRAWVHRGELRDFWAGSDLRIRLDDLLAYLGRNRGGDVVDIEEAAARIMSGRG